MATTRPSAVSTSASAMPAGEHDLGEVAVTVVLGGGQRNRVLEAAFLEVLRHLRGVHLRLIARLREGENPLDGDAERPHRHEKEHEGHGLGHESHLLPHCHYVHGPTSIETKLPSRTSTAEESTNRESWPTGA